MAILRVADTLSHLLGRKAKNYIIKVIACSKARYILSVNIKLAARDFYILEGNVPHGPCLSTVTFRYAKQACFLM